MKAYIDTNIFIYSVFAHPQSGRQSKHIIDDVETGKLQAVVSTLVPIEIMSVVASIEPSKSKIALELIYSLPIKFVDANSDVLMLADEIVGKYRIGGYDAIHVATSLIERADSFITNDRQFKRVNSIRVVLPTQYGALRGK
ncbi:MAG: type II toxin-antitoxin system VapC family toxin [Thaumarchaeota archaeon]|nr:type II toxin-antitoxin system VapC family toxin [Nitrososphaerota archaeon]